MLTLVVLSVIPWPGPTVFKISCPRDSATIVRKIVQKVKLTCLIYIIMQIEQNIIDVKVKLYDW